MKQNKKPAQHRWREQSISTVTIKWLTHPIIGTAEATNSVLSCLEVGFGVLWAQEAAPTIGMAPVADVALRFNDVECIARFTPAALDEYTRILSPRMLIIRLSVEETIRELMVMAFVVVMHVCEMMGMMMMILRLRVRVDCGTDSLDGSREIAKNTDD